MEYDAPLYESESPRQSLKMWSKAAADRMNARSSTVSAESTAAQGTVKRRPSRKRSPSQAYSGVVRVDVHNCEVKVRVPRQAVARECLRGEWVCCGTETEETKLFRGARMLTGGLSPNPD